METQHTVVLYCEEHDDGQVTPGGVNDPVYEIRDHMVEVPMGHFANVLVQRCMVVESDFGGKFQFPRHVYRRADKDELARYVAGPRTRVTQSAPVMPQSAGVVETPLLHIEDVPASLADLQRQNVALQAQMAQMQAQLAAVLGTRNVLAFPDGGADHAEGAPSARKRRTAATEEVD